MKHTFKFIVFLVLCLAMLSMCLLTGCENNSNTPENGEEGNGSKQTEVTEPEATEPEVTEPEVTEPDVTESEATESEEETGHSHRWSDWAVVVEATCTEVGTKQRCCSCREIEYETIDALGHTGVIDNVVEPTCTETGLTEGQHCSVCNEVLVAQEIIPVKHSYVDYVCSMCNAIAPEKAVQSVTITNTTLWYPLNTIVNLEYQVTPADAIYRDIKYIIDDQHNTCGATISETGVLSHTKLGSVRIQVSVDNVSSDYVTVYFADFWDGSIDTSWYNTTDTEFIISNASELAGFAKLVNSGASFAKKQITLADNICLGDLEWTPIGTSRYSSYFGGIFDGNGYVISHFKITKTNIYAGFFGYSSATIKNLGLENFTLTQADAFSGFSCNGGLVGYYANGEILNCYVAGQVNVSAEIDLPNYVGGLVGYAEGASIKNCHTMVDVNVIGNFKTEVTFSPEFSYIYSGGLVGYSCKSTITNCYTTGTTIGFNKSQAPHDESIFYAYTGGLIAYADESTIVSDCYSTGKVEGSSNFTNPDLVYSYTGGLIGYIDKTPITNSYSMCDVTGNKYAGGLIGYAYKGTITNCYANGNVDSPYNKIYTFLTYAGGLVAYNDGTTVTDSHAGGSVSSPTYAGGLIAYNEGNITNSYATGAVYSSNDRRNSNYAGGLIGYNVIGTITGCYATGEISCSSDFYSSLKEDLCGTYAGGLVAYNDGTTILNCYSTSVVFGATSSIVPLPDVDSVYWYSAVYVGGLVGYNSGAITNCKATGKVFGDLQTPRPNTTGGYGMNYRAHVGGLVGRSDQGTITNAYATGDILATVLPDNGASHAGGLAGSIYNSTIINCYATGNVTSNDDAGGLVGDANYQCTITNCFATGDITVDDNGINTYKVHAGGGLVCYSYDTVITNCYRYSGQSCTFTRGNKIISNKPSNTKGTEKNLSELQSISFQSTTLGWSADDWNFVDGYYPTLKNVDTTN